MAQGQHRRQGDGRTQVRRGRGDQSRSHKVGEISNPRRWLWASLITVGLLCVPALSQLPGSPDEGPAVRRGHGGQKGKRHGRKRNGPKQAGDGSNRESTQAQPPLGPKAEPSPLGVIIVPKCSERLSFTAEPCDAGTAEPTPTPTETTPTDAANAPVTPEREVTSKDSAADPPPKTDSSPEQNVAKPSSAPAEGTSATNRPVRYPNFEPAPSLPGVLSRVISLSVIQDSNSVFVETFKNKTAHEKIVNELGNYPKLRVVETREEADFIISYTDKHDLEIQPGSSLSPGQPAIPTPIVKLVGEMVVYKVGAKREGGPEAKDVLWSEPEDRAWLEPGRHPATNLTRHFIKDLRRLRGEIK